MRTGHFSFSTKHRLSINCKESQFILGMCVLLHVLWLPSAGAQGLYRYPFQQYLGSGLESTKTAIFGGMPYDGIGKRTLLEQVPETWLGGFQKLVVPTTNFVDAYGVVTTGSGKSGFSYQPHRYSLQADRFGNLSVGAWNNSRNWRPASFQNRLHFQQRWQRDLDQNKIVDYHPGHRLAWVPWANLNLRKVRLGIGLRYLDALEWGGEPDYWRQRDEPNSPLFGHSQRSRHLHLLMDGNWDISGGSNGTRLEWLLDSKRHWLDRKLGSHQYEGRERVSTGYVNFRQNFGFWGFNTGVQYNSDELEEQVNTFSHQPTDRFWRLLAGASTYLGKKAVLKGFGNLEKRDGGGWSFLPSGQLDIKLGKGTETTLSLVGQTGQRPVKPVSYHLDWLAVADRLDFRAKPIEKSGKIGANLLIRQQEGKWLVKLATDHTRFRDKAVISFQPNDKTLVFNSLEGVLNRSAVEWLGYARLGHNDRWEASLMYRFEHFSQREAVPFQAAHSAMARLRFRKNWAVAECSQMLVSPQNLQPVLMGETAFLHRTDFSLGALFQEMGPRPKWLNRMEAWAYWDNAAYFFQDKTKRQTAGLLLYPLQGGEAWNAHVVGNIRLELVWRL